MILKEEKIGIDSIKDMTSEGIVLWLKFRGRI